MRQGVNAYGYKIKATHLELRTESKRKEKRKIKAMIAKLREGKKTRREIQQEVNSWLGFARWASASQPREEDIRALPLHQSGRSAPLWRNISASSSSADFTTTVRY